MSKGTFSCSSYCATNDFPLNIKEWPIGELIFGNKATKMSGSAPTRPNWLVNDEKESKHQGEFFKRLQIMKESLLQTEEHNLRDAIARIENKKYGRRRMVLTAKNHTTVKKESNPRRFYSTFHEKYHGLPKFDKRTENPFSPLREKGGIVRPIDRKSGQTRNKEISVHKSEDPPFTKRKTEKQSKVISRQRYSETMLFNAKKKELAQIATNLHNCESDDHHSLIRNPDALPSIPSVGHRKSFTHKNRVRAMTWESEFSELPKVNSKGGSKKQSEVSPLNSKNPLDQTKTRTETTLKKKNNQELKFDVNPKDREIFKHLNTEIGPRSPKLPTPPVNSRLANHSGNTIVPQIVLPNMEDEGGELDSARGAGDLNTAMQKLVTAHTDLESLKEELKDIANINEDLQSYEAIEGCSTKL